MKKTDDSNRTSIVTMDRSAIVSGKHLEMGLNCEDGWVNAEIAVSEVALRAAGKVAKVLIKRYFPSKGLAIVLAMKSR